MTSVLVVHQFALPRDQGGGTRHVDLFSRVPNCRPTFLAGDVSFYTRRRYSTEDDRFVLLRLPRHDGNGVMRMLGWAVFAVQAVLHGLPRKADVVYASTPQLLAPVAGWVLARLKRVPFVLEVRDLWPESIVSAGMLRRGSVVHRVLSGLERWLYRRADRIVTVTAWSDHFTALGVALDKVSVIPNGTELSDFETKTPREELRARYGLVGFTAVFAGAHGAKDGIPRILDAAAQCPDIDFLLVGDGAEKQAAVTRAQREDLSNVSFREPVAKTELPGLLRACDVGLHVVEPLPIFDQGMSPNKLFDYLAAELPVVSNARHPLRHVLDDGDCGRLVDPDALVQAIRDVREADAATCAQWRTNASTLLRGRYSRAAAAESLHQVLTRTTHPLVSHGVVS